MFIFKDPKIRQPLFTEKQFLKKMTPYIRGNTVSIYLFICGSFNDTASRSDYIATSYMLINT
jgi:hypothetical protein